VIKGIFIPIIKNDLTDRTNKNSKHLAIRLFTTVVIGIVLLSGCTLRKGRIYRVGILSGNAIFINIADGFKDKMIELGYIEGKNIEYDFWKLNNDPTEEENVIKKFIADKVDLMLVFSSRPAKTAKALTQGTDIPVVFAGASIEGIGLVESQRQPGGNISGVRFPTPEMTAKRLEILLEMAPHVTRVLVFCDTTYPSYIPARQAIDSIANKAGITIIENPTMSLDEIHASLEELEKSADYGFEAIFLMPDLVNGTSPAWEIFEPFAIEHRIPLVGTLEESLQGAGLFIVNSSHLEIGSLAAVIVDKILHGAQAGSIPVATPNLNLYINYRAAQDLGLTVPEGLLKQAHKVIR